MCVYICVVETTRSWVFQFIEPPRKRNRSIDEKRAENMSSNGALKEAKVPLIQALGPAEGLKGEQDDQNQSLRRRVWIESSKLWQIVGPAIFSRLASYSMLVITQAFAGHLGDLELAAISIANNVIVGFDFGLLVPISLLSSTWSIIWFFA